MSVDSPIEPGLLQDGELTVVFTNFALHRAHRVPTYHFRMVHGETAEDMGRINLRTETNPTIERYAGHIGYSVHEKYRGHHYAARSVILLLPLARWLAVDPIWITCNAENLASRRSCELAGAELIEIVDVPPDYIGYLFGDRQKCRYRLWTIKGGPIRAAFLLRVGKDDVSICRDTQRYPCHACQRDQ